MQYLAIHWILQVKHFYWLRIYHTGYIQKHSGTIFSGVLLWPPHKTKALTIWMAAASPSGMCLQEDKAK